MSNEAQDPWDASYQPGVPRTVEIPDEPLSTSLERAVATHPHRTALHFMGARTNYEQLGVQVSKAATCLLELGVEPGDRVAIALPNCPSHVVAFLAVVRIGAVVVEHNPLYTEEELERQLVDSGAVVAVCWQSTAQRVAAIQHRTSVRTLIAVDVSRDLPVTKRVALRLPIAKARALRTQLTAEPPASALDWHTVVAASTPVLAAHPYPSSTDLALLQYTGGTTGNPKGAMLTHRNLIANAIQGEAWTGLHASNPEPAIMYGVLPLFHAYGLTLTLIFGVRIAGTVVLFPKFDVDSFIAAQRTMPATFMAAVPPMLDRIVAAVHRGGKQVDFSSLKYVLSGAMPLPRASAAAWEELTGGLVIEGYGLTECSPIALGNPLTAQRRPGELGLPFPSTDVRIVSQEDPTVDVPLGQRGELLVSGPQVFSGYWQRPAESAGVLMVDRGRTWLRTGDVVIMDEFGFSRLVDRIKEMIITGGFKVYPSQVEEVLRAMPGIEDVAVVGMPGGDLGERVVAAIVLRLPHLELPKIDLPKVSLPHLELPKVELPSVDLDSVREWCTANLARYAIPKEVVIVPELPRSQIGKVLRRVVREDLLRRPASTTEAD